MGPLYLIVFLRFTGTVTGPTQFDSSMFAAMKPVDSPTASTPEASGSDAKSKHKKKKKKNKKHKHKHKHERHDKEKEKMGSQVQRTFSESIILDHPFSSDASNSPAPRKPPDSPEFEVI